MECAVRKRPLCVVAIFFIVGIWISGLAGFRLQTEAPGIGRTREILRELPYGTVVGTVESREVKEERITLIVKDAYLVKPERKLAAGKIRIRCDEEVRCGSVIEARGDLDLPEQPENPGQYDFSEYDRLLGITATMNDPAIRILGVRGGSVEEMLCRLRMRIYERIRRLYPEETAAVLGAVLIGNRSGLTDEERTLWRDAGVLHMLAISGLHLTLLGMWLFRVMFTLFTYLKTHRPEVPGGILTIGLMLFYTVLTGMSVSALRAFLMLALLIGAKIFRRTYDTPTACAAAAVVILCGNPGYLTYSGFQLSFSAVLLFFIFKNRGQLMRAYLLWLWMIPLVLSIFYEIPLYSVPVNVLALPFLPFVLGLGFAGIIFGTHMPVFAMLAAALISIFRKMLSCAGSLPCASLICGSPPFPKILLYLVLLALWTWLSAKWRLYKRRFLILPLPVMLVVLLFVLKIPSGLEIDALSVGQGDSLLLTLPKGQEILIDGGSSSVRNVGQYRIIPFLKYSGVRRLDYVFATHMDEDHVSGIRELLRMVRDHQISMKVSCVALPYLNAEAQGGGKEGDDSIAAYRELCELAKAAGARVLKVQKGDEIGIGNVTLRIRNPDPEAEEKPLDPNAQCIVVDLQYGEFDALFCGDVCGAGEEQLIRELRKERKKDPYEYLKVAHHGSRFSTPEEFLKLIRPEVGIISCGKDNSYGHPHEELLERLRNSDTMIARTDQSGMLRFRTDGKKWTLDSFMKSE